MLVLLIISVYTHIIPIYFKDFLDSLNKQLNDFYSLPLDITSIPQLRLVKVGTLLNSIDTNPF